MTFEPMNLPFETNALEPYISARTMTFHHDKHYKKYIETLNVLMAKSVLSYDSLKETLIKSHDIDIAIYQNAAQAWNHEFYWKCLSPAKLQPTNKVLETLEEQFGSVQEFKENFNQAALTLFGSGWVWVIGNMNGDIEIKGLENAENPLTSGQVPLLVCDVWEHAYYLDYQNDRTKYMSQFWEILNWKFFEKNIVASKTHNIHTLKGGQNEIRAGL
ncbi:MAG: superoxide dismutase [Deltaproteobacteria bacterium]|nr:superoxide dismutase [Deltaproteobacteria bacterium]